jgi:hypothetical protein
MIEYNPKKSMFWTIFRYILVLLAIIVPIGIYLAAIVTNTPPDTILSLFALLITTGGVASEMFLRSETRLWQYAEEALSSAHNLFDLAKNHQIGQDFQPLIEKRAEVVSKMLLIKGRDYIFEETIKIGRDIRDRWNPRVAQDPLSLALEKDVRNLLDYIKDTYVPQRQSDIFIIFESWCKLLGNPSNSDFSNIIDSLDSEAIPQIVSTSLTLETIQKPQTLFQLARPEFLRGRTKKCMSDLLDSLSNSQLIESINGLLDWISIEVEEFFKPLILAIEKNEIDVESKKNILRRLLEVGAEKHHFLNLGSEGVEVTLSNFADADKRIILGGRLYGEPDEVLNIILRNMKRFADDKVIKTMIGRLPYWGHRQKIEFLTYYSIRNREPLLEIAMTFITDTQEDEQVRIVGLQNVIEKYGQLHNQQQITRMIDQEPNPRVKKTMKEITQSMTSRVTPSTL